MSTGKPVPIRVSHQFAASAERVFDAWFDARHVGSWLFATPDGEAILVELDPRVGGAWRIVCRRPEGDLDHHGTYLEISRPHRLVFSFAVDDSPAVEVTVEITPLASGCEVVLSHELPPEWAHYAERTTEGWTMILASLDSTLR